MYSIINIYISFNYCKALILVHIYTHISFYHIKIELKYNLLFILMTHRPTSTYRPTSRRKINIYLSIYLYLYDQNWLC